MRKTTLLLAMIGLLPSPMALANDDPFAPAKAGKIECLAPDSEKKTCVVMTRYEWDANGNIFGEDEMLMPGDPPTSVRGRDLVTVNGTEVCGVVNKASPENVTYLRDGVPLPANEQAKLLEADVLKYSAYVGKTFCKDFSPYESVFIVQISIDGQELPSSTNRMKWVDPKDGYSLTAP
jgi:hypothetical protein